MTTQYTTEWDLSSYYISLTDPQLSADLEGIMGVVDAFCSRWESRLKEIETAEDLKAFYEDKEAAFSGMNKPGLYLFYLSTLDTQNTEVMRMQGRLENIGVKIEEKTLWIADAWKTIGYERLKNLSKENILAPWRGAIEENAESVKYLLSPAEERILTVKSRTISEGQSIREELVGSYTFEVDGKSMTEEEIRTLRASPNRDTRRKAQAGIRKVYTSKQSMITLWHVYVSVIKDSVSECDLRGFESVMGPRNASERMNDAVVSQLISSVRASYGLYHRYLRAKQRILNLDTLEISDVSAPITATERTIPYEKAVEHHLSAVKGFDSEFYEKSLSLLTSGRIDVYPRAWKRGGAFCAYEKNEPSRVLLNYTSRLRDVATLSHELGHAVHGELSQVQKASVFSSPLSLAETASIFCEMLLSEHLKGILSDDEKRSLLDEKLSDIFATIHRQIQYIAFERDAHEAIRRGEELTYKELSELWRRHQRELYPSELIYDTEDALETSWATIPHIFETPFYCYTYAFGQILVLALWEQYQRDGQAFIDRYKSLLRSGGNGSPEELLKNLAVDITSEAFYDSGLSAVEKLLSEYESLAS